MRQLITMTACLHNYGRRFLFNFLGNFVEYEQTSNPSYHLLLFSFSFPSSLFLPLFSNNPTPISHVSKQPWFFATEKYKPFPDCMTPHRIPIIKVRQCSLPCLAHLNIPLHCTSFCILFHKSVLTPIFNNIHTVFTSNARNTVPNLLRF